MAEPYHVPPALGLADTPNDSSPGETAAESSEPLVPTGQVEIAETLEELAREGARRMLERALHSEVDAYLGRRRYDRVEDDFSGYRNGYAREREISIGTWSVEVRPPRVADTPGHIPPFRSSILPRGRSLTYPTQRLFARLYLEGMSSGDFEPAFRELLGSRAPLSSSTILRLKEDWRAEYTVWRTRPLSERYLYIWSDGIYLGVGTEVEHSCLLVVIGARSDGRKELLAMELGYRESTASWADVLRDLRDRGLEAPMLAVGDGALGLWAALREVFPETRHQRCWNHKAMNLTDKVPKRLQPELRHRLRAVWNAPSRRECELRRDELAQWLHTRGQDPASETLFRDWDDLTTFYDFPAEHWIHLRTSNPVESVFAGVRLRTNVSKRMRRRDSALYLVFKITQRLELGWRPLNGGLTIMTLLLRGARFVDGIYIPADHTREEESAA
ncbi:MAG: IS256 family transposase [Chloroflexi bacterium]|nr:IS256 family transposase [Chloroflexota bacterium]